MEFQKLVKSIGYDSYDEYLQSQHWKSLGEWYRQSCMPRFCLICKATHYQLHHIRYERLGRERLSDVIPLCGDCHTETHKYIASHPKCRLSNLHPQFKHFGLKGDYINVLLQAYLATAKAMDEVAKLWKDVREYDTSRPPKKRKQMNERLLRRCQLLKKYEQWDDLRQVSLQGP